MAKKLFSAGVMRHRIEIQEYEEEKDSDTGATLIEWTAVSGCESLAAAIEPFSASQFMAAQAQQSKIVARITIRYREGLNAAMRILHRGKVYNIEGLLPDADSGLEYLTIPVSEGVNAG